MKFLSDMEVYSMMIEECSTFEKGYCLDRWEHRKFPLFEHPIFYYMGERVDRDFIVNSYHIYKKWNMQNAKPRVKK